MNTQTSAPGVGKYRLLRKLATGGMAEVYLANMAGPAGFSKTLVLKRILPHLAEDQQFVDMFLNEAKLAALLNHPNIVSIFDLGEFGGNYFIAMEYIDGPNLRSLCTKAFEKGKTIPFVHAAKVLALACEGLGYAHDFQDNGKPMNLIHRDISPDNILLSRQGAVKVVDFGIAKAASQPHLTKTGTLKGKLAYMPPEQLRGKPLDRRADIFALGVVLYELISGVKPFDSTSDVAAMQAILHDPPTPIDQRRDDCPAALAAIIDRALEKPVEKRYPDCRAMQKDLEKFVLQQGASIGSSDLAQVVADMCPLPPPRPQLTPLPDSLSGEVALSGAISLDASPKPTGVATKSEPRGLVRALEDEAPPQRRQSGESKRARYSGSKLLVFAGVGVVVVGLGVGFFLGTRGPGTQAEPAQAVGTLAAAPIAPPAKPAAPSPAVEPAAVMPEPLAVPPAIGIPAVVSAGPVTPPSGGPARPGPGSVKTPLGRAPKPPAVVALAPLPIPVASHAVDSVPVRPPPKEETPRVPPPAAASATGLAIETDPPCAISVDGRALGMSPVEIPQIAAGQHSVLISSHDKGITRNMVLLVNPGEMKRERVKFGKASLIFRVRPYANVEIDGKPYGQTPFPNPIELYEGEHRIRLTNPELKKDIVKPVMLAPGKQEIVKVNFEE